MNIIATLLWIAYVGDYTDPIHHNHISHQPLGTYQTLEACEADLERQRRDLIGGVVVPKGVIVCMPKPELR